MPPSSLASVSNELRPEMPSINSFRVFSSDITKHLQTSMITAKYSRAILRQTAIRVPAMNSSRMLQIHYRLHLIYVQVSHICLVPKKPGILANIYASQFVKPCNEMKTLAYGK